MMQRAPIVQPPPEPAGISRPPRWLIGLGALALAAFLIGTFLGSPAFADEDLGATGQETSEGEIPPVPTETPVPPTSTPEPTSTPMPTETPTPTETATPTTEPTSTPTQDPDPPSPTAEASPQSNGDDNELVIMAASEGLSLTVDTPVVSFETIAPGSSPILTSAVTITVSTTSGGWAGGDCTITGDAENPSPAPTLSWRLTGETEWQAFGPGNDCIPDDLGPGPLQYSYDVRLVSDWANPPGSYSWTVTFTVLPEA
jgi:hypothetical protein